MRTWISEDLSDGIEELIEIAFDGGFEISGMQFLFGETLLQRFVSGKGQVTAVVRRPTNHELCRGSKEGGKRDQYSE